MSVQSAGLLLFRRIKPELEVFLAHPGGPFWKHKDAGAWTIPKGRSNAGEEPLAAACREFLEETSIPPQGPYLELGTIRQRAGKIIHAWAWEGDADPARVQSNMVSMEYPRHSGRQIEVPEIDRCEWFSLPIARQKLNPAQAEFLLRLETHLAASR